MKIALVHPLLVTSTGGERQVLKLAVELQNLGHSVELFVNAVDPENCYTDLIKKVKINVIADRRSFLPGYYHYITSMYRIGMNIPDRFDVINNHNFPSEWAVYFARKRIKTPTVWMCNEPPWWFLYEDQRKGKAIVQWPIFEIFDRMSVKSVDKIMVLSQFGNNLVNKIYGRSSTLVRTGVDAAVFQGGSGVLFREKYNLNNKFLILQVGTLIGYKHPDIAIKALKYLPQNAMLVLVGIGFLSTYKKLAEQLGLSDRVIFIPSLPENELVQAYKACDVLLFPAEQTWGLVVVEAMASGKPVIVYKYTGVAEIIENNVNGLIVRENDPKVYAQEIISIMEDRSASIKIGNNAMKYVVDNLSWETYAKSVEKVLQESLINKP